MGAHTQPRPRGRLQEPRGHGGEHPEVWVPPCLQVERAESAGITGLPRCQPCASALLQVRVLGKKMQRAPGTQSHGAMCWLSMPYSRLCKPYSCGCPAGLGPFPALPEGLCQGKVPVY